LWISPDDYIKIADKLTGNVLENIEITPSIKFFTSGSNKQHLGYYICSDDKAGMAYVILGDSRQIFALKSQK